MALTRARRVGLISFGIVVLALVAIAACWPLIVPRLIYVPRALPENHRSPTIWGYTGEEVRLRTPDGEDLHGWHLRSTAEVTRPCTILFTHGNGGNVTSQAGFMRPFLAAGFDALIIDYRGYGMSSGRPSEEGLYIDARAAFDYLRTVGNVRGERIIIVGHSLGSAVATELATRRAAGGLILAAPFTSFPEAMNDYAPWIPVGLLHWKDERFDSGSRIGMLDVPILMVFAADDRLVPERNARELFDKAPHPRQWVDVPGGHNEVFSSDQFSRALIAFASGVSDCAGPRLTRAM